MTPVGVRGGAPIRYALVAVALLALAVTALCLGEVPVNPVIAIRALAGDGLRADIFVVQQVNAPRLAAGLVAGAGLALSGVILQRLSGNALASPEVIGINAAASLGAVLALALGTPALVPATALAGAFAGATLLLAVAGRARTTRLILVGIAAHFALGGVVNLFIVRFPAELARAAYQWTVGSLYGAEWHEVAIGLTGVGGCLAAALLLHRRLKVLELGDELGSSLGLRPDRTRLALFGIAVALAAFAVALAGPIAFVALAVPHLARRLVGPSLAGAALTGSALLVAADLTAQYALGAMPVGAVTATLGAPWLLVALVRRPR